jgi:membrane-bound serine protease (ClpP class)
MVLRRWRTKPRVLLAFIFFLMLGAFTGTALSTPSQSSNPIIHYRLSGEITGVTANAINDLFGTAQSFDAQLIIIELTTSGGEIVAIQSIMDIFASSAIPVLVYVPTATLAVGGGTYLLMASHIAAMGPAARIGTCQPIMGIVPAYDPNYIDFIVTLMTSHAHLHERNETTASRFIHENLNLEATEAFTYGITELTSISLTTLLSDLESYTLIQRELNLNDSTFTLVPTVDLASYSYLQAQNFTNIASVPMIDYIPNVGLTFLAFLAHPLVNFVLLQIGIWGFLFALNAPGHAGEIISFVCIILALVGMGFIGFSIAGVLLMVLGFGLILIEAKTDIGFAGAAGIGGAACFALGGVFFLPPSQWLIPTQAMVVFQVFTTGIALLFAALFSYGILKAAEARKLTSEFAEEKIIGKKGIAITLLDPEGRVRALGEEWSAIAEDPPIKSGESIEIVRLDGIRLVVKLVRPPPEP